MHSDEVKTDRLPYALGNTSPLLQLTTDNIYSTLLMVCR
jgi:hypothetical protein